MHWIRVRTVYLIVAVTWATAVGVGLAALWRYESTPGRAAQPPARWPADTGLTRRAGMPTLVLFAHPHCPCTRATIAELAKLMTECHGEVDALVLFVRPPGMAAAWERTDLWNSAGAISGVRIATDEGAIESRRFGALTSGQALLYAADGRLLFAGGITESRGHEGDNAGRSAIAAIVHGAGAATGTASTPVYGCPLMGPSSACMKEGTATCHTK